ncbi:hypothetical protein ACGYLO_18585 [Sulfitobacter sp. 1A13353]|uniref:hypothetical protein n=1 Tax=Sulfitobacter sp. 1A13353 TaxID=3368568 RepID=UPI003745DA6C
MKNFPLFSMTLTLAGLCAGAAIPEDGIDQQNQRYMETRAPRMVMPNPYDDVMKIQQAQAVGENELKIRELYERSAAQPFDSSAQMRAQLASIKVASIDPDMRNELLNLDAAKIEVERISRDEANRDMAVPTLSMIDRGEEDFITPRNIFLKDWELTRTPSGETIVGRVGDPLSKLNVRVGMILGEFGRIMAVRDTEDAFYLVLESGDRIQGKLEGFSG